MIAYGTKIISDIDFSFDLVQSTEAVNEVEFSSKVPSEIKNAITCGFPFYHAHGRQVYFYSDRNFDGSEVGQPWCHDVVGVAKFYWRGGERTIYYELEEGGDVNMLGFWFIHLVLPLYMTLENMYDFLHAGAVEVKNRTILFIAPSMGGKSTMTDYFLQQGHILISDDKVATYMQNGKFMAVPSHPYHRPYRKFEDLGYRVYNFSSKIKPIDNFYVLEKVEANANITIEEIKGFAKFDVLLPNYLYMFSYLKQKRLKYITEMLNNTKVFNVKVPWNKERLNEVYTAICKHVRT